MGKQYIRHTIFLLSFLVFASPALAGVNRWTPYGPPQGTLQTLAADAEGNLYTSAAESGVYKSTDRGETWFWSGIGMGREWIQSIVFDPDDDELYAAGETGVFRSTDAGAHWTRTAFLPFQPSQKILALAPGEPDTLFLGDVENLYRSRDDGATWQKVLEITSSAFRSLVVDPNNPQSVFAGTFGGSFEPSGLLHSADGGTTWVPVTAVEGSVTDPFSAGVTELVAAPTTPTTLFAVAGARLYRSIDAGATWQEIQGISDIGEFVSSVAVSPGPQPRVYVFLQHVVGPSSNALFVSDDLGETWELVTLETRAFSLRVTPSGDLLSLSPGGVGVADEDGTEWRFSPLGQLQCGASLRSPNLRFGRGGRLYATVGGLAFISRNNGRSWAALAEELADQCVPIQDVALDPRQNVLWLAADHAVYRSGDGGETWDEVLEAPGGEEVSFSGITLAGRTVLANGCGVWRSQDDGATWQRTLACEVLHEEQTEPEFLRSVVRLEVDPKDSRYVYAGAIESGERHPPLDFPYVYKSADGGRTWSKLVEGAYVLAIDPSRPETIYRAQESGIYRSRNRGRSWQRISRFRLVFGSFDVDLEVDPFHPNILYAARFDGVWRSVDGGVTWQRMSTGLRGHRGLPGHEIFPDPRNPGRLVLASEGLFEGRFPLPD